MSTPSHWTPLPVPTHLDVGPAHALSEKEQTCYDLVLAHFANPDYVLPDVDAEKGALMEEERMWLSYECLLRYIRATKHDTSESIKRLEGTLKWRREFGLYSTITPEHVEPESVTGKEFIFGYDTRGRPALYLWPSRQNTEESPRQIHFVVWMLERCTDLMGPGVESIALMIDYADKAKSPSFSTARQVLYILQTHYPERLGAAVIAHLPWFLNAFYKLITPLIDPLTRLKMVFNPVSDDNGLWRSVEARDQGHENAKLFENEQLVKDGWSGTAPFTYSHETYWPALLSMTEARRKDMIRVWRELGGVVGIKEWDVKVGVRDGLATPAVDVAGQAL
ncbi:CRAL TRIO domain-containing protein [Chiua virens]|nr:CRAL TRIO domain-containing protein [Chiua virens]